MGHPLHLLRCTILTLASIALAPGRTHAQMVRPGLLVGRVNAASGGTVAGAVIRVSRGATIHLTEGEEDGDYRVEGLGVGRWQVSVRREGFEPLFVELEMPGAGLRRDFTLVESADKLDAVLVASGWRGVRGIVSDSRGDRVLAGASLRLMGSDSATPTDSLGRFEMALAAEKPCIIRVGRTGYATRLITGETPSKGYLMLDLPLDTTDAGGTDYWIWRDLERRLKYATPRAAQMTRAEIAGTGAASLGGAIESGRSVAGRGILVTNNACLFVDGRPRPGATVDAIRSERVEFIEAYPEGTDLTRTLASRWPTNAVCGTGSFSTRPTDPRRAAQFVVVWLRAP